MGFAELIVIAIVGLIVVGPDKLPQAIKSGLVWFGRVKRMINDTRAEVEQQLGVDEIRREIHNEQVLESLKALKIAKEEAEKNASEIQSKISEDFGPEDEGLFGEQHANHPPPPPEPDSVSSDASQSDTPSAITETPSAPSKDT